MTGKILAAILLLVGFQYAGASEEHKHQVTMPKEFDTLKQMAGTWEGKTKMGETEQTVTATYEITSGGTAVIERLMAGTPHEMVSIYHKDGTSMALTHYCAMGNQPKMALKKAEPKALWFEMTKPIGVTTMKEPHMHAMTLTMVDGNTVKEDWVEFDGGKQAQTMSFTLKRKK